MPSNATTPPLPDPDVDKGIEYWASQPPSYDGVLGTPLTRGHRLMPTESDLDL